MDSKYSDGYVIYSYNHDNFGEFMFFVSSKFVRKEIISDEIYNEMKKTLNLNSNEEVNQFIIDYINRLNKIIFDHSINKSMTVYRTIILKQKLNMTKNSFYTFNPITSVTENYQAMLNYADYNKKEYTYFFDIFIPNQSKLLKIPIHVRGKYLQDIQEYILPLCSTFYIFDIKTIKNFIFVKMTLTFQENVKFNEIDKYKFSGIVPQNNLYFTNSTDKLIILVEKFLKTIDEIKNYNKYFLENKYFEKKLTNTSFFNLIYEKYRNNIDFRNEFEKLLLSKTTTNKLLKFIFDDTIKLKKNDFETINYLKLFYKDLIVFKKSLNYPKKPIIVYYLSYFSESYTIYNELLTSNFIDFSFDVNKYLCNTLFTQEVPLINPNNNQPKFDDIETIIKLTIKTNNVILINQSLFSVFSPFIVKITKNERIESNCKSKQKINIIHVTIR